MITAEVIQNRIIEIENEMKSFPKVKAGNPLQAVKWQLTCEKRRLRIKLSRVSGFTHTLKDELELIKSVDGACAICGNKGNPSVDHIIPLSKGGHDGISNLRVLCGSCNSKKGAKYAE